MARVLLTLMLIVPGLVCAQLTQAQIEEYTGVPGATQLPSDPFWDAKLTAMCAELALLTDEQANLIPGTPTLPTSGIDFLIASKAAFVFVLLPDDGAAQGVTVVGEFPGGTAGILGFTQQHWCSFGEGGVSASFGDQGDRLRAVSTLFHETQHITQQGVCIGQSASGGDPDTEDRLFDAWFYREECSVLTIESEFLRSFAWSPLLCRHILDEIDSLIRTLENTKEELANRADHAAQLYGGQSGEATTIQAWHDEACTELEIVRHRRAEVDVLCP